MEINLPGAEVEVTQVAAAEWEVSFQMLPAPAETHHVDGGRDAVLALITRLWNEHR